MSKQEFLRKLKEDLSSLTDEELKNALKYYDEYFADAHEEHVEQQLEEYNITEDIKNLGEAVQSVSLSDGNVPQPAAQASTQPVGMDAPVSPQISENAGNAGQSVPPSGYKKAKRRKLAKGKVILLVGLLLFAAPILVPVALTLAGALFALFMAVLSVSLAIGCAAIAGLAAAGAGVFSIGYGIVQIFYMNMGDALYHISVGLMGTGIGIIIAYLFGKIAFAIVKYEFKFLKFIGKKIFIRPAYNN